MSVSVIRKLERGDRESASLPTLRKLAGALGATTVDLFQPVPEFAHPTDNDDRDDLYAVRRVLQPARPVVGTVEVSLADDDDAPTVEALGQTVRELNGMFRDSAYAAAVAALPTAVTQGRRTVAAVDGDERLAAWWHLAQAYQTAGLVLIQLRCDDLAYHALGLAMDAGRQAEEPALVAAAVCGENWLLTRQARFDEAERAALASAEAIEPSMSRSPLSHVATWGWLNMGAASAAARNGRTDVAGDALRRARAAAYVAGPYRCPHVAQWTRLSPAVVAIREVELAMVNGDAATALRLAQKVPPDTKPAVSYQRCQLDVAAAHVEQRRHDDAMTVLQHLRGSVPGWLRYQRYGKRLVEGMVRTRARAVPTELRELADFFEVA